MSARFDVAEGRILEHTSSTLAAKFVGGFIFVQALQASFQKFDMAVLVVPVLSI